MSDKKLTARIISKHELQEDWDKAEGFIPYKGEIVVYDSPNETEPSKIKIGTGNTAIKYLPFIRGVGVETPEGGEIFNDYKNNAAVGEGTSARGLNTQAGNLAFKILSIDGVIKNISEYKLWDHPYTYWPKSKGENISGVTHIYNIADRSSGNYLATEINSTELVQEFPRTQEQIAEDGFIVGEAYYFSGKVVEWADWGTDELVAVKVELNRIQRTYKEQPCYLITVQGDVTAGNTPYAIDDILQIECKLHYNNAFKIVNIEVVGDTSIITIVAVDNRILDSNMVMDDPTGTNMEEDWVYVVGKNNGVICPQLRSSFVGGIDTQATGFASVGFGRKNIASGNYSAVFGRGNVGGYAALVAGTYSEGGNGGIALGNGVKALGNSAVATGVDTYARAASSRAGGRESQALSEFTVAEGLGVIAGLKQGQVVHGKYNVRNDSHLLIIGDGKSNTERHDAFAITEDYKVLLDDGKIELADTKRVDNILYGSKTLNGTNNEASGTMALATGSGTTASGNYSFAGGVGSRATARSAVAIGEYNKATVQGGFAGGINAEANGFGTVALGYGVNTINSAPVYGQMAVGKYNVPNSYSLFMVGNGTSKDDRKNVFEVRNDGSAYLETQGNENNSVVIKSHLDSRIADIVNQLASAGLQREVVETLPEINNANETTIYMVANNSENEQNIYDEYMLINGVWEMIGSTQVDLSNYYTKEEIDNELDNNLLNFYNKEEISSIIENMPGEKTTDGGEIFNLYKPIYEDFIEDDAVVTYKFENVSVGPYTTANGKGTQAGNKAFKILDIKENNPYEELPLSVLGSDEIYFYSAGQHEVLLDRIRWPDPTEMFFNGMMTWYSYDCYDPESEENTINKLSQNGLVIGDTYLLNIVPDSQYPECGHITSIKHKVGQGKLGEYFITLRGNVLETTTPYEIGDIVQIECKGTFINTLKIESIETDTINEETVSILKISPIDPSRFYGKNDLILQAEDPNNVKNWLYVAGKNDGAEPNPQSIGAFATGYNTIATGRGAFVSGENNKALGRYSAVVGRQNIAGYAGFTSGRWNTVLSQHGFASGNSNTVLGSTSGTALGCQNTVLASYATAIGRENQIGSVAAYSLVTGYGNKSQSEAQFITGKFSKVSKNDIFAIGNGTSDNDRSNVLQVTKEGEVLINNGSDKLVTSTELNNNLPGKKTDKNGTLLSIYNNYTEASNYALASGYSKAKGQYSTALGWGTSNANYSFATGYDAKADGFASAAFGYKTQATGHSNFVIGKWNNPNNALFTIGNGTSASNLKNAFQVFENGTAYLEKTDPNNLHSVVIKSYLDEALANVNGGGSAINNGKLLLDNGLEIRSSIDRNDGNGTVESYFSIQIGKDLDSEDIVHLQGWDSEVTVGQDYATFGARENYISFKQGRGFILDGGSSSSVIQGDTIKLQGTDIKLQRWADAPSDDSILTKKEIDNNIKTSIETFSTQMNQTLTPVYPNTCLGGIFIEGKRTYVLDSINLTFEYPDVDIYDLYFYDTTDHTYDIAFQHVVTKGSDPSVDDFIQGENYLIEAYGGITEPPTVKSVELIKEGKTEMELVDKVTGEKYKIYIENGVLKTEKA